MVAALGCEVQEPPKKASGSILKAFPEQPAERALHPDLKAPGGGGIDGVAPDLKPLVPDDPAEEPEVAPEDSAPAEPPLHPDLKAFPAKP